MTTPIREPAFEDMPGDELAAGAAVAADDQRFVFHSWSAQRKGGRLPVAGAQGCHFWDFNGNRYLDFSSQMVNLNVGHAHPRVVEAIREQAARLCTISPTMANDQRNEAARLILEAAPGELAKVFFTNGGAEANEHAIRMARVTTGRPKILASYRSYHGATDTALAATGDPRRWPTDAAARGVVHFFGPFGYRSAFHATSPAEESERALAHLTDVIAFEGPATVAAIILETIPGSAGVLVPPDGYLAGVRRLCDEYGILLILDEVMTGFGRVGEWFAADRWQITPDLMTFAKGVNSGYVPLGGVVVSPAVAEYFSDRPYPGGLTYSGHPLACAAAVATISAMRDERLIENAAAIGEHYLGPGLRRLAERHPSVGEVRGLGVFWALDLLLDPRSREPLVPHLATPAQTAPMTELMAACKARGLWPLVLGNRLHIAPPCVVTPEQAEHGLDIIDAALVTVDNYLRHRQPVG